MRRLHRPLDQLAGDPQGVVDEEVGRRDVELGVGGVLGLGRIAGVDRLRQRPDDAHLLGIEIGRRQGGHAIAGGRQAGPRVAALDQRTPADAHRRVVGVHGEVRHVQPFERLALGHQHRPDLGRVVRSVDGPVQRVEGGAPPAAVLLIARTGQQVEERRVLGRRPRQDADRRAGERRQRPTGREQRVAVREQQPIGGVEAGQEIGGEGVRRLDRPVETDGVADAGRERRVVGDVQGIAVEVVPDAPGQRRDTGPGAAQPADVEHFTAVRLDHRHEAGRQTALVVARRRGRPGSGGLGRRAGRDRLAAGQRRRRRGGDLADRLQQHLEIDQDRAAPRRDHVLHVEIAAAQHVGQAHETAGQGEVGADLGQVGARFLLDELDPAVLPAIEHPQGEGGEARRDVAADAVRDGLRGHPTQEPAVGVVQGQAARLVDDPQARGERQGGDAAAAVVCVGQRRLDVDDQAGVGAVAEGRGERLAIDDDPRGQFRRRRHPPPDHDGHLARQDRIGAEQRHQAVGELGPDEDRVAALVGGPERLELVEQRQLRGARQRPQQVPLETGHGLRIEDRRRVLRGQAAPRHPQHRHQQVEERRQLGVAGGFGRRALVRRLAAGRRSTRACGGIEAALGQRTGIEIAAGVAGGPGDGVDVLQPVGLDDRDRRLGQRPGDVGHRQVVPVQAPFEGFGIAGREGLDPGAEDAQRLLGGGERLGPAGLAGEREGGALEDAGGPDRNLAPLVTGQVGELGQRLHRGHPRHGFRS